MLVVVPLGTYLQSYIILNFKVNKTRNVPEESMDICDPLGLNDSTLGQIVNPKGKIVQTKKYWEIVEIDERPNTGSHLVSIFK